jgi:hypothetical protein
MILVEIYTKEFTNTKPRFATLLDGTLKNILNDKDSDNSMVM